MTRCAPFLLATTVVALVSAGCRRPLLTPEDDAAAGTDILDNDGDGLTDCDDPDCAVFCAPKSCGDGVCDPGETCTNCSGDCGACPGACDDGVCDPGETCKSCASDCGTCPGTCGDGTCDPAATEDCFTCPADCPATGGCGGDPCGDGVCAPAESCLTCGVDCGSCTPVCGNQLCDGQESCSDCERDCGTCGQPCTSDSECSAGAYCTPVGYCYTPVCGDGTCDAIEDCDGCPQDCGAGDSCAIDGDCCGVLICLNLTCALVPD